MTGPQTRAMTRREFQQGIAAASVFATSGLAAEAPKNLGAIRGEPTAEKVGLQMLAGGGNAIDAVVAAALAAAIVVPHQTGIGGYGGAATLAVDGGRRITSIDFNTMAPAAMKADTFAVDAAGKVLGDKNKFGWLATG